MGPKHSCAICKEKKYPLHKTGRSGVHFVACKDCIRSSAFVASVPRKGVSSFLGFFGDIYRWIRDLSQAIRERIRKDFNERAKQRHMEQRIQVQGLTMLNKAKNIPVDPSTSQPTKR